ncbi:hypothetical protein KIW84_020525 [Lathyrus oleraceus]|uniref:Uncharacterized protein n=1 Tax=Pisum sativum TaxID=3888 RepID=A0A9D4Y5K4_PEA|nr:hypothetical protein KIW84_020525 [Pisum sativum]
MSVPPPIENQSYNRHQTGPLRPPQFDPIPMAYTELLPYLIQKSLVFPWKLNPLVTYPPNFKHNAIYSTNVLNKPTPWSYNITTHARENAEEARNESKEFAPNEESEKEDSKDCHIDSEEHDNPNLWVGKVQ